MHRSARQPDTNRVTRRVPPIPAKSGHPVLTAVVEIVLPVFGLVGVGLVLGWIGFFPEGTGRGMENYLYRFALPLLIFNAMAKVDLPGEPHWSLWAAYFTGMTVAWVLAQAGLRAMGRQHVVSVLGGFTAAFSNQVLIGIPLVISAFGKEGLVPQFLIIAIHMPLAALAATVMIEGAQSNLVGAAWRSFKGLITHPILLGLAAGLAFNLLDLSLHPIPDRMVGWIAESAVPCALVAMGLAVRRTGLGELSGALLLVSVAKLLVHPAIVFVLAVYVFDLPPLWTGVLVLTAACPPGLNAYLLALPHKQAIPLTSAGVTVATGIAVVTVSVWLSFLLARMP